MNAETDAAATELASPPATARWDLLAASGAAGMTVAAVVATIVLVGVR